MADADGQLVVARGDELQLRDLLLQRVRRGLRRSLRARARLVHMGLGSKWTIAPGLLTRRLYAFPGLRLTFKDCQSDVQMCRWSVGPPASCKLVSSQFCESCVPNTLQRKKRGAPAPPAVQPSGAAVPPADVKMFSEVFFRKMIRCQDAHFLIR